MCNLNGDVYPIPPLPVQHNAGQKLCRVSRQRICKRLKLDTLANESIAALNSAFLGPSRDAQRKREASLSSGPAVEPNFVQRAAQQRIWRAHASNIPPGDVLKPEAAFHQLLQTRAAYDGGTAGGLATFEEGLVSLPPVDIEIMENIRRLAI